MTSLPNRFMGSLRPVFAALGMWDPAPEAPLRKSPAETIKSDIIDAWLSFEKEAQNASFQARAIADLKIQGHPDPSVTQQEKEHFEDFERRRVKLWYEDSASRCSDHIRGMRTQLGRLRDLLTSLETLDPGMHATVKNVYSVEALEKSLDDTRTEFRNAKDAFTKRFPGIAIPQEAGYHSGPEDAHPRLNF